MRPLAMLMCLVLSGCETYQLPQLNPPDSATAIAGAKRVVAEYKLVGAVEVSPVREAHPISPGPYVLCVRGAISNSDQRRTYAAFFKDNVLVADRMSVIIDSCETQAFTSLQ